MRAKALLDLLDSVKKQILYPDEILIIDGSLNDETKIALQNNSFPNLSYYLVDAENRGLTKQRNFGIDKVAEWSEIVCFLDDDTILDATYFDELLQTYQIHSDALGVGGYINNEVQWEKVREKYTPNTNEFYYDGWKRKEGSRFILRKKLGLDSNKPPCFLPDFSHGRSVGFLPPSGKIVNCYSLLHLENK